MGDDVANANGLAAAINDAGTVAGYLNLHSNVGSNAAIWRKGMGYTLLPDLRPQFPNGVGFAINNRGVVGRHRPHLPGHRAQLECSGRTGDDQRFGVRGVAGGAGDPVSGPGVERKAMGADGDPVPGGSSELGGLTLGPGLGAECISREVRERGSPGRQARRCHQGIDRVHPNSGGRLGKGKGERGKGPRVTTALHAFHWPGLRRIAPRPPPSVC